MSGQIRDEHDADGRFPGRRSHFRRSDRVPGANCAHFHGQAHVASVYQSKTLREISEMIRDGLLDPESVVRYTEDIHSEMPPDEKQYDKDQSKAEEDWRQRFAGREHDGLSVYPKYLQEDTALLGQNLWQEKVFRSETLCKMPLLIRQPSTQMRSLFFSRVHDHFHLKATDCYRPLNGMLPEAWHEV